MHKGWQAIVYVRTSSDASSSGRRLITPTATEHVANPLIAQDFLVGSARFESDDRRYVNRALRFAVCPTRSCPG